MIRIRKAIVADSAGIARVQVDSYRTAYAGILTPEYLAQFTYEEQEQDWRDWQTSHPADLLYVAEKGAGEIAGYALGRRGSTGIASYDSELVALHVRRLVQRQGIGRQLFSVIAEQLKERGCLSLMLWVLAENPARSFYERLGGELIGEQSIELGEGGFTAVEVAYGWSDIDRLCGLPDSGSQLFRKVS